MRMSQHDGIRLLAGVLLSPVVPIIFLSWLYWQGSGGDIIHLAGFFAFAAYASLFTLGIPVIGFVIARPGLANCIIGGGIVAISPVLLIRLMTFFDFTDKMHWLSGVIWTFIIGCAGGLMFWIIAYSSLFGPPARLERP